MRKGCITVLALSVSVNAVAASQQMIWGSSNQALPQLKQHSPFTKHGLLKTIDNPKDADYQLELIEPSKADKKHVRYQITYKNLPVWGHQLVFHKDEANASPKVTGINVSGIEKDVINTIARITPSEAEKEILAKIKEPIKFKNTEKVIFIDKKEKAHLAYHISFFVNNEKNPISAPNYLVDANSGEILQEWNDVRKEKIGQGLGGNSLNLPYRSGMFQHGDALPNLPSLGKFDVQLIEGKCYVQNDNIRVINLENYRLGYEAFPISVFNESLANIEAFSYPCSPQSQFINYSDGSTGPINFSFSPVNDTMYFAQKTLDMYDEVYGVENPIGTDDLPLRAYTHLGLMDNAFAIPTIKMQGFVLAHQQIVIGNGSDFLTAPTQSVIAHELSHNFTELNSGLYYEGQSGAINEAFSDMAAIAMQDYVRQEYPWYWDGEDWALGREAVLDGSPIRYMDDPTQDGNSIGHAKDYTDDLDVHLASGVFNKAFYLLSNKPGWSVPMAFQLMVDANQNYWSPIAYYDFAACGVIQAAIDRELNKDDVIASFAEVGVHCPMYKSRHQDQMDQQEDQINSQDNFSQVDDQQMNI
ncbi:M4 family metallopeptidase [Legionella yabuuchiae]|uniref:M4 family metallopeptidase n=1 Tax=Legionella yabuuchiae TaxID=376727 RepID=UPI001054A5B4|nr:M4 family metallopeptidase [Legionella yabuuchiae]